MKLLLSLSFVALLCTIYNSIVTGCGVQQVLQGELDHDFLEANLTTKDLPGAIEPQLFELQCRLV